MFNHRESELRRCIARILAEGLRTETEPFPETNREFAQLLVRLRELPAGDLKAKLVLAGLTDKPYGPDQMRCQECMYYLVHRKWCDLPEMSLPVEADWWCRLWRI